MTLKFSLQLICRPELCISLQTFALIRFVRHFLGAFGKLQTKQKNSDYWLRHICLSFRLSTWNNSAPTGRISINPLNAELNPICYLLALLAHNFLHVSRIRVKSLTFRLLMSYIYGAPILDVSRSHTTTQHSR